MKTLKELYFHFNNIQISQFDPSQIRNDQLHHKLPLNVRPLLFYDNTFQLHSPSAPCIRLPIESSGVVVTILDCVGVTFLSIPVRFNN